MRKEAVKRFPTWFNVNGDVRQTLMPFRFQWSDGCFEILWRLCVDLEPMASWRMANPAMRLAIHAASVDAFCSSTGFNSRPCCVERISKRSAALALRQPAYFADDPDD